MAPAPLATTNKKKSTAGNVGVTAPARTTNEKKSTGDVVVTAPAPTSNKKKSTAGNVVVPAPAPTINKKKSTGDVVVTAPAPTSNNKKSTAGDVVVTAPAPTSNKKKSTAGNVVVTAPAPTTNEKKSTGDGVLTSSTVAENNINSTGDSGEDTDLADGVRVSGLIEGEDDSVGTPTDDGDIGVLIDNRISSRSKVEVGLLDHTRILMNGFHADSIVSKSNLFPGAFILLYEKYTKLELDQKKEFLTFLVPLPKAETVDLVIPKINPDLVNSSLFERLFVGRMLVEFDLTFALQPTTPKDITGSFKTVLLILPAARALKIVLLQGKTGTGRADARAEVRSKSLLFLLSAYLDLLFPTIFDTESTMVKTFCLSIAGYKYRNIKVYTSSGKEKDVEQQYLQVDRDRLPPVSILLSRLLMATRKAFASGIKRKSLVWINPLHGQSWRASVSNINPETKEEYPIANKNMIEKDKSKEMTIPVADALATQPGSSIDKRGYPLFGIGKEIDPASLNPDDFMPQDDYCSKQVVDDIEVALTQIFPRGGCTLLKQNDRNPDAKLRVVKYNIPGTERWSMVFAGQSIFSEDCVTRHFGEMNRQLFLKSSNDVGNDVTRDRMYRCALYPEKTTQADENDLENSGTITGAFSIASDSTAMGCVSMCKTEVFFANFGLGLMERVNSVVKTHSCGKYHVQCVAENIIVQNLFAGMGDSAYGYHDDGGPELCHELFDFLGIQGEERELLLESLSQKLMWVFTVSLSNYGFGSKPGEMETSELHLMSKSSDPRWKNGNDIATNWASFHLQLYGNQFDLEHKAVNKAPEYTFQEDGKGNARHVMSFRNALTFSSRHINLLKLQFSKYNYSIDNLRADYTVKGVVAKFFHNRDLEEIKTPHTFQSHKKSVDCELTQDQTGDDIITPTEILLAMGVSAMVLKNISDRIFSGVTGEEDILLQRDGGTARDPMRLWQRLASYPFFRYFQTEKINLVLHYQDNSKEKIKGKKRTSVTHSISYGKPPFWRICSNYKGSTTPGWQPLFNLRDLQDGDIVETATARNFFGVPSTPTTQPPWKHIHSSMCSAIFLSKRYKSSYEKLDMIQNTFNKDVEKGGSTYNCQFTMNECGGSAQNIGATAKPVSRSSMTERDSALQLPTPQAASTPSNMVLYNVHERMGCVLVFRQPLKVPAPPKKHDDFLQFLGVFYIKSIDAVSGSKQLALERAEGIQSEHKVYCSFLLMPHKEITMSRVLVWPWTDEQFIFHNKVNEEKLSVTQCNRANTGVSPDCDHQHWVSINGGRRRRRLEREPVDPDNQVRDSESKIYNKEYWRTLSMDISSALANYHMRIPLNTKIKGVEMLEEIAEACEPNNLVKHFHENVVKHIISSEDETKAVPLSWKTEEIVVTKQPVMSVLRRMFVAGSCRFVRKHLQYDDKKKRWVATFLDTEKFHYALGGVPQTRPSPMPIRTYDLATLFLLQQAQNSFSGKIEGRIDLDRKSLSIIQRRRLYDCDDQMIADFIFSSAVIRVTGRVEKIQAYLVHKKRSSLNAPKNSSVGLLNESDAAGLPSFMALLHSGDAAFDRKGVTTEWMSPQFSSSIPNSCKRTPRYMMKFLKKFCKAIKVNLIPQTKKKMLRSKIVAAMVKSITHSCSGSECPDSVKFVAGQIVSDMEEMFCNDNINESPFEDDEIITGYGGREGFSIFCTSTDFLSTKKRNRGQRSGRVDVRCQDQLRHVCTDILNYIEHELSADDLIQLGLEKIKTTDGEHVIIRLTGRRIFSIDVEHMMCKVYLAVAAYRGSRSFSVPAPWRPHCHPTASTDIFTSTSIKQIFMDSITSFETSFVNGSLDTLVEPFCFQHEKV
jgi:hypothetical protein